MKIYLGRSAGLPAVIIAFCVALCSPVYADDAPLADGTQWLESSTVEKTAYLLGAGNFMTIEYVVQQHSGNPPTDEQSSVRRFWEGSEAVSLNELISTIDRFYKENPDKLTQPVLMVIWDEFVEKE